MRNDVTTLLIGATAMGSATIALIFLRYWTRTRDSLFAAFAIAFGCFALSRVAASLLAADDDAVWAYALRCVAFGVILVAVISKNRSA
jgi:hypothetical protein